MVTCNDCMNFAPIKKLCNDDHVDILNNPDRLNKDLPTLSEDQLKRLINYEVSTKCRRTMIERLHQRYAKLYTKRQRDELIAGKALL